MEIEIDTSGIQQAPGTAPTGWRPPRHVYFGKKGPDGVMEEEPVYTHQSFPKMIYQMREGKLFASLVNNDDEHKAKLADGWKDSPADFGVVTAPSFEQIRAQAIADQKPAPAVKAKPAKAEAKPDTPAAVL